MTLVDTSVWIDHLRSRNRSLVALLESGQVLIHPFVIGEISCGSLRNRREVLRLLQSLPAAARAADAEVLALVENRRLFGLGVGWIDVHLVASALLTPCGIWTLDARLREAAHKAGLRA
jgi:predicted nucleic acid-binding protein